MQEREDCFFYLHTFKISGNLHRAARVKRFIRAEIPFRFSIQRAKGNAHVRPAFLYSLLDLDRC